MLPLIYTNRTLSVIFLVACLIWIVPEMWGAVKQTARASRKGALIRDNGSMAMLIGLQWMGLICQFVSGVVFPEAAILWQRVAIFGTAMILILLGVGLRWYAIWTLGHYFTRDVAVSTDQRVIQTGPYRYIRHPAYSGTFLTMLGVGLAMTNWVCLLVVLVGVFSGHMYRVHVEEKVLIQTIGSPYLAYMQHTKRFIPWLF